MKQARELLSYCLLMILALWTLITWVPLAITGGVTIVEPSVGIRYMELGLLTLVLSFTISQYVSWVRSRRRGN